MSNVEDGPTRGRGRKRSDLSHADEVEERERKSFLPKILLAKLEEEEMVEVWGKEEEEEEEEGKGR